MRNDPAQIALFRCLKCRGHLRLLAEDTASDGHVMQGTLNCNQCGSAYAVRDGIPRFAPNTLSDSVASTVEGFGFQWTRSNHVLRDARFSAPDVFIDFVRPVEPEYFVGKTVLDGGCGLGRFSLLSAEFGAALVVGVDLSEAVVAAFANTRHLRNVVIAQCDLFALPFDADFDYVFSVGVLHHTSDPRGAFQELAHRVRPGGGFSAWVYAREGNDWIIRFINPIRRITSHWPRAALMIAARLIAIPLWLMTKCLYRPVSRIKTLMPLRRFLFYFDYMVFLSQFGYREQAVVVFDHMVPELADYVPRSAFAEWFRAGGLADVVISSRSGNSWRGFGVKLPA